MVTFNMKHDFELGIIAKFCFVSKIKRIQKNFYPHPKSSENIRFQEEYKLINLLKFVYGDDPLGDSAFTDKITE